ncbi:hypothetical protein [Solirubrobacter soli]|uniref:hypothetical protein n=1 Tax=Solirubrobacter soli TaxID=363832 RepID=UPI0003FAACAB|nr:hypothetical protein [Solirubrobacter soli]
MSSPHRGLLAGLLALIVFAAGAVAMAAHAPTAAVPTSISATSQTDGARADGGEDGRRGRGFVGFRDER